MWPHPVESLVTFFLGRWSRSPNNPSHTAALPAPLRLALEGTYSRLFNLQAKGYQWPAVSWKLRKPQALKVHLEPSKMKLRLGKSSRFGMNFKHEEKSDEMKIHNIMLTTKSTVGCDHSLIHCETFRGKLIFLDSIEGPAAVSWHSRSKKWQIWSRRTVDLFVGWIFCHRRIAGMVEEINRDPMSDTGAADCMGRSDSIAVR